MKENKKEYPLTYFLVKKDAEKEISQGQKRNKVMRKVMRSVILIGESERASNAALHWKPISKIY